MIFQESGDFDAIFVVPFHPQMERLGATIGEEAVEWRRDGAGGELNKPHALGQSGVAHRNGAHQHVGMTVHVFGARVEHDVGA